MLNSTSYHPQLRAMREVNKSEKIESVRNTLSVLWQNAARPCHVKNCTILIWFWKVTLQPGLAVISQILNFSH